MEWTFYVKQVDPSASWMSYGGWCDGLPSSPRTECIHPQNQSCWESWLLIYLHWITFWGFPSAKRVTLPNIPLFDAKVKEVYSPPSIQDDLSSYISTHGPHGPLLQPHMWVTSSAQLCLSRLLIGEIPDIISHSSSCLSRSVFLVRLTWDNS